MLSISPGYPDVMSRFVAPEVFCGHEGVHPRCQRGRVEWLRRIGKDIVRCGGYAAGVADLRIQPLGDAALRVELGRTIDPEVNRRVRAACAGIERAAIPGVVEWVPAYAAVTVHYRPHVVRYAELVRALEEAVGGAAGEEAPPGRLVTLPVVYDGPDLAFVAAHHGLAVREVVELHSRPEYLVYMIGFAPGFPYLGGLPERLATPRLEKPRLSVPAGSVGIGGAQTGVYPVEGPGGWRIIGRTSVALYDPRREPPALLAAGDRVRFQPVRS